MEVDIGRYLVVGLHTADITSSGVHGNLGHALLLVLMQPIGSQFVDLLRRHIRIGSLDLTLDIADSRDHST